MIRNGTSEDIPKIIEMAREFWTHTMYEEEFEDYIVEHLSQECINQKMMIVLDVDGVRGFACGLIGPLMASSKAKIGQEVAWWVDPDYRKGSNGIKLLKGLEGAAKLAGVKYWNMIFMKSSMPDVIEGMYQKMGYTIAEVAYCKRLD